MCQAAEAESLPSQRVGKPRKLPESPSLLRLTPYREHKGSQLLVQVDGKRHLVALLPWGLDYGYKNYSEFR